MKQQQEVAVPEVNMTNAQKQFKKDHAILRASVETPFAWLKNTFNSFAGIWNDGDDAIGIAFAVY